MKKLILLYFLFMVIDKSFSQTSQAYHSYGDFSEKIIDMNGFKFVAISIQTNAFIDSAFIIGYRPNGKQKFRYRINLIEVPHVNSMTITQDSCLLVTGYYAEMCDVYNSIGGFIIKLDTNGVEKFSLNSNPINSPDDNINMVAISYPTWKNIIYSKNHIDAYDEYGNSTFGDIGFAMSIVHSATSNVYDSIIYMSHSEITTSNDTIHYLSANDPPGYPSKITHVGFTLKKILINTENFIYGLTSDGKIIKFNTNLDSLGSTNTILNNLILTDFDIKQDTIYASTNSSLSIVKFDKDLNLVYQKNNTYPGINCTGISVSQNAITLIGQETPITQILHPNYFIAHADLSEALSLPNDAYIEDFSLASYSVSTYTQSSIVTVNFSYNFLVKINNNSSDTLKNIYINHRPKYFHGNSVCGIDLYHHLFKNLNIPPNSYGYVTTPIVTNYNQYMPAPTEQDSLITSNYCLWTSAPNFQCDANHNNDAFCKRLALPIVTGVNQLDKSIYLDVYPNPNNGVFHVNYTSAKDAKNYTLKIINTLGETLFSNKLNDQDNEIDLSILSNGIYLLSIYDNEKQIVFKKIVKQ